MPKPGRRLPLPTWGLDVFRRVGGGLAYLRVLFPASSWRPPAPPRPPKAGLLRWLVLLPDGRFGRVVAPTKSEARAAAKLVFKLPRLPAGTVLRAGE